MEVKLLRVVKYGEMTSVKSEKAENGVLQKRTMILQELGGKYEPSYVVTALGTLATLVFREGDLVFATLRSQSREFNGQAFQDIVATELVKK